MGMVLTLVGTSGCKGRSLKVPNPVFADAPPRRSLVNHTADAEEQKLAMTQAGTGSDVQQIGFSRNQSGPLTGTTVVAEVNGKPLFVDDVLGGARQIIESDPRLPDSKRQEVIEATLRKRLPKHVEDELIVQALEKKIPDDKRDAIKKTLEPQFQKVIAGIKEKEGFVTDQQLNERLAREGISVDSLRDNFIRMQMVEGYIGTSIKVPETIDRELLVNYYQEHISDYTPVEEVRFAEIVIRFRDHGGREGRGVVGARQRAREVAVDHHGHVAVGAVQHAGEERLERRQDALVHHVAHVGAGAVAVGVPAAVRHRDHVGTRGDHQLGAGDHAR